MIEFRAERRVWSDSLEIYARQTIGGQVYAVIADGLKAVATKNDLAWPVFIALPLIDNAGQSLFDALWSAGFRPNSGESSVAHVNAMQAHLQDLRTLVFKNKP